MSKKSKPQGNPDNSNVQAAAAAGQPSTAIVEVPTTPSELATTGEALTTNVYRVEHVYDPMTGNPTELFGIMVEFKDSDELLKAARRARDSGYKEMDCYSSIPIEGLTEAMGWRNKTIPLLMLIGGFVGCATGYSLCYFSNVWFYPLNIGGKPMHSWPQFIVPSFECTILFSALTGVFSMLGLNGLPRPYHPVFNAPGFENASTNGFYLCIESKDPKFDREGTMRFMRELGGLRVIEVEP